MPDPPPLAPERLEQIRQRHHFTRGREVGIWAWHYHEDVGLLLAEIDRLTAALREASQEGKKP